MTHKNPFEIRSDVLKLAKEYMDTQHHLNVQLMNDMYEMGKASYEDVQNAYQMYTTDELVKRAQEMYFFVCDKKK